MDIFNSKTLPIRGLILIALGAAFALPLAAAQDPPARAVLDLTEAQQKEFIVSYLNRGMPSGGAGDAFTMLVLNRSSMTIPMIEHKIEEVLDSASPSKLFLDKGVDPTMFVATAASAIAYAGNIDALKATASLMRKDKKQFAHLVSDALYSSLNLRNPMTVSYQGLDLADADLDPLITQWLSKVLSAPSAAYVEQRQWAEAMLDRYHGTPTESQWNTDPIVTRLPPERALAMHDRVMKLAVDAWSKRKAAGK